MRKMTLQDIQSFSLEILKVVDKFCKENNITYFLAYGTLLGAVRHKGFIPWDDDIDILLPRPDYERLLKTFNVPGFKVFDASDPNMLLPYSRICDTTRTLDLFPLDAVSDDPEEFKSQYKRALDDYRETVAIRRRKTTLDRDFGMKRNGKTLLHRFLHPFRHFQDPMPAKNKLMAEMAACPEYGSTAHVSMLPCPEPRWEWFPIEDFASTVDLQFCDVKLPAPVGWDHLLHQLWGDYMQLPPEKDRHPKQTYLRNFWL